MSEGNTFGKHERSPACVVLTMNSSLYARDGVAPRGGRSLTPRCCRAPRGRVLAPIPLFIKFAGRFGLIRSTFAHFFGESKRFCVLIENGSAAIVTSPCARGLADGDCCCLAFGLVACEVRGCPTGWIPGQVWEQCAGFDVLDAAPIWVCAGQLIVDGLLTDAAGCPRNSALVFYMV